jgi:hypothetical protein
MEEFGKCPICNAPLSVVCHSDKAVALICAQTLFCKWSKDLGMQVTATMMRNLKAYVKTSTTKDDIRKRALAKLTLDERKVLGV